MLNTAGFIKISSLLGYPIYLRPSDISGFYTAETAEEIAEARGSRKVEDSIWTCVVLNSGVKLYTTSCIAYIIQQINAKMEENA